MLSRLSIAIIFLLFIPTSQAQTSICPDVDGAVSHVLLSNYKNSCVVGYNETKFDAVTVPTSEKNNDGLCKELTAEGKVIDVLYAIENSQAITVLEVQRNYEQAIKNSGLQVVYSAFGKKKTGVLKEYTSVGGTEYLGSLAHLKDDKCRLAFNHRSRNQENEAAYFVAQGTKEGKNYTLVLYVN
ncbi:MAG: hypothetical protein ACI9J3_002667 [Parvicellaceae bacterium]|jgi:hypothetical protein